MQDENLESSSAPEMDEPACGGTYMRDPETGDLVLIDQTKPAVQVEKG